MCVLQAIDYLVNVGWFVTVVMLGSIKPVY